VNSDAERVTVLLRVLELDPHNATARHTLDLLQQRQGDANLPHVNPFSLDEEMATRAAAKETPEQPFISSGVVEEIPDPAGAPTHRLTLWIAVAALLIAVVLIFLVAALPRF
jgi:hypothetical protein